MASTMHFERLVIAAYRLPFKFIKSKNGFKAEQNSGGLVSAILALSENFKKSSSQLINSKIVWAGTADNLPDNFSSIKFENESFDIAPVNISSNLNNLYYGGFCNDLIWPLFHYFPSYSVFNNEYFKAYEEANSLFCDELLKIIKPGDFIWIHDYQLMLLPEMIRKKAPDATIGFFLHIPFPSFEIFRLLPRHWRETIINGLLGADLIGFHTHDYTQHFIKSVKRTTGFECQQNIIYTPNKLVKADAFPIGIDYEKFHSACLNKQVLIEKEKIKSHLNDQKLIFSVDRLDYSKGLMLRLKGYETFLERFPKWHSKVVFNMVVVPSRGSIEKYKDMKKEIESTIGRINGKYSTLAWRPIIYQYKSLSFDEMVALYDLSDVGLITPLRDGMNLVAKEYVACQIENKGVLILSEMAGAAAELNEALIVNPADDIEISEAIFRALEMKKKEKFFRLERMQNRISTYNVFTWAFDFFNQTFETKEQQKKMNVKFIDKTISSQILFNYQKAANRILFLDYDGTLVNYSSIPSKANPPKILLNILIKLVNKPELKVIIISGRGCQDIDKFLGHLPIDIIAEHGAMIKNNGEWKKQANSSELWKKKVLPILNQVTLVCPNSIIEEKLFSLSWHYRNAESGYNHSRKLIGLLDNIIHTYKLKVLDGNQVVEVMREEIGKGKAVKNLLEHSKYDYILSIGDDKTDEEMFEYLMDNPNADTIKVGNGETFAKYKFGSVDKVIELLKQLSVCD